MARQSGHGSEFSQASQGALVLLGLTGVLLASVPASAAETETRQFKVLIDNKSAGNYHMTIVRQEDGTEIMAGVAEVKLSYLVYTYKYNFQGNEVWKAGRLVQLKSCPSQLL